MSQILQGKKQKQNPTFTQSIAGSQRSGWDEGKYVEYHDFVRFPICHFEGPKWNASAIIIYVSLNTTQSYECRG